MSRDIYEEFIRVFGGVETKLLNIFLKESEDKPKTKREYQRFYNLVGSAHSASKILREDEISFLKRCGDLRNCLSHGENPRIEHEYFASPSPETLSRLSEIENRISALKSPWDIAIKTAGIYSVTEDARLVDVIRDMRSNSFSHVPILSGGRIVGIFGEDVLFNKFLVERHILFSDETKMKDILDYSGLCTSGRPEVFKFVGKDESLETIEKIFSEHINKRTRLSLILITETGSPEEKLLGLLTIWDMPRAYSLDNGYALPSL